MRINPADDETYDSAVFMISNDSERAYRSYRSIKLSYLKSLAQNPAVKKPEFPDSLTLSFFQGVKYFNMNPLFAQKGITVVKPTASSPYYEISLRLFGQELHINNCDFYIREFTKHHNRDIFAARMNPSIEGKQSWRRDE